MNFEIFRDKLAFIDFFGVFSDRVLGYFRDFCIQAYFEVNCWVIRFFLPQYY